jgi:RNA polymerase sigma-70 factor (ECF subfamily)
VKNDEDAADLTQQVFLKALTALPGYQPYKAPFGAWLFCIARHTAIDLSRRQKSTISWDLLPALMQPIGQDPSETAQQREEFMYLGQLLAGLDPSKRELLALRFAAGLNAAQIAVVVGKSHASVQKQLKRILLNLKENLSHA